MSLDKPQERAKRPHTPSKAVYKLAFRVREEPEVEKWMRGAQTLNLLVTDVAVT